MSIPLSAHQRIALHRRFPTLTIEMHSISIVRFRIGDSFVQVHRPPFADWMVSWPYMVGTMLHPPSDDAAIYALRARSCER
jgi:hypothetical protein